MTLTKPYTFKALYRNKVPNDISNQQPTHANKLYLT